MTQERMKNFDAGEVAPKALDFIKKSKETGEPFFVWWSFVTKGLMAYAADGETDVRTPPVVG